MERLIISQLTVNDRLSAAKRRVTNSSIYKLTPRLCYGA